MAVTQAELEQVRREVGEHILIMEAALPFTAEFETVQELMHAEGVHANLAKLTPEEKEALLSGQNENKKKAVAMKLLGPKLARAQMITELEATLADPAKMAEMKRKWGF